MAVNFRKLGQIRLRVDGTEQHPCSEDGCYPEPTEVAVTLGEAGPTTLAENVVALPKERYRVEEYIMAEPADVDGICIDDIAELGDLASLSPVKPAPAIALTKESAFGTAKLPLWLRPTPN